MAITNLNHRCPICNTLFRVAYDRDKITKGLDITADVLLTLSSGFKGHFIANQMQKGRDILIRKITGRAQYKFKCPKCHYESDIIF